MPYKLMYAFIDESDSLCHGRCLVIGAWMTAYEEDWYWRIKRMRREKQYPYELHFHKISRDPDDQRYLFAKAIAETLVEHEKSWYARCIYVSKRQQARWQKAVGKTGQAAPRQSKIHAEFLNVMADRFFGHAKTEAMALVTDAKQERWFDQVFLEDLVKRMNTEIGERRYTVFPTKSNESDLLQVADLVVGCVAQIFNPVENPNKKELARILQPLTAPSVNRIGVWKWSP